MGYFLQGRQALLPLLWSRLVKERRLTRESIGNSACKALVLQQALRPMQSHCDQALLLPLPPMVANPSNGDENDVSFRNYLCH